MLRNSTFRKTISNLSILDVYPYLNTADFNVLVSKPWKRRPCVPLTTRSPKLRKDQNRVRQQRSHRTGDPKYSRGCIWRMQFTISVQSLTVFANGIRDLLSQAQPSVFEGPKTIVYYQNHWISSVLETSLASHLYGPLGTMSDNREKEGLTV